MQFNKVIIKNNCPLLNIDDFLLLVIWSSIVLKIYLECDYHQLQIKDHDISKMAFHTRNGHYEFYVMSFGLTKAPDASV